MELGVLASDSKHSDCPSIGKEEICDSLGSIVQVRGVDKDVHQLVADPVDRCNVKL